MLFFYYFLTFSQLPNKFYNRKFQYINLKKTKIKTKPFVKLKQFGQTERGRKIEWSKIEGKGQVDRERKRLVSTEDCSSQIGKERDRYQRRTVATRSGGCGFGSTFEFCICVFLHSFFSPAAHVSVGIKFTIHVLFNIVHALFWYYLRTIHETHSHFIQEKNIKNGSHGTIYTFKNYFATVF